MSDKGIIITEKELLKRIDEMCAESLSPDIYSMWIDKIVPALNKIRFSLQNSPLYISPSVAFYCKNCKKMQGIYPIMLRKDKRNSEKWADVVCRECNSVIATVEVLRKRKVGMYGDTPRITIGKFIICEQHDPPGETVWIEEVGEDGSEFRKDMFEKALKKFYDAEF